MPDIKLYIQPGFTVPGYDRCYSGSPFVIKVARLLNYKRVAFDVDEVGWMERGERLPTISASGKLPVLEYDGERIEDSTIIGRVIEERHPGRALVPKDAAHSARCHFLEDWADEVFYWQGVYEQRRITNSESINRIYFADFPESLQSIASAQLDEGTEANLARQGIGRYPVDHVKGEIRRGLDALLIYLESDPYVAGPRLSFADLALFGQFSRRLAGTNPWLESEVASRPLLAEWVRRVDQETQPANLR